MIGIELVFVTILPFLVIKAVFWFCDKFDS